MNTPLAPQEPGTLPAPTDPTPRTTTRRLLLPDGNWVQFVEDSYSDRVRCDHPRHRDGSTPDGALLGEALADEAEAFGRGRVVVLAPDDVAHGLMEAGFEREAKLPGFYEGTRDGSVLGLALDDERACLRDVEAIARVDAILDAKRGVPPSVPATPVQTVRATVEDAPAIAALIADTFEHYPTPSGVPEYVANAMEEGTPFRVVREHGEVVACASADLVPEARTAELTDCATRPDQRGRGLMRSILRDLMGDLRALDYPTAFTLARATEPGINVAFQRLGFAYRGRMVRSCRIGDGLEDMNVWSRGLAGSEV